MKTVFEDFAIVVCAQNKQFSVSNTVGWFFGDEKNVRLPVPHSGRVFVGLL